MFSLCYFVTLTFTFCPSIQTIHYSKVVDRSTEFIVRYEGFSSKSYKDTRGFSIGYGTRSYEGEMITEQEAYSRMSAIVRQSVRKIVKDFPNANEDQIVALASLAYNCHSGLKRVKREGFEAMKKEGFCLVKGYNGLLKRRSEERKLIFGDVN